LSYLLDTNVVSEVRRTRASAEVVAWFDATPDEAMSISVLVLGEIRRGIERLRSRDPDQAATLERWLQGVRDAFADRIVPIDGEIAEEWGRIGAASPIPPEDGLMAATAKVRGLILVTRNVAHVARPGVRVLNPWEPPPA
jgi:predicted nucleic acid-binding protein